jgi:peptidoglycan/xylan/chitin deacetylase (PgdA/CDA1 family)
MRQSRLFGGACGRLAWVFCVATLAAGCASVPPPPSGEAATAPVRPVAVARGQVLGENDRFIVYEPTADDTLRSIALRFLGDEERYWTIGDFNGITKVQPGQPVVVPLKTLNPMGVQSDQYQTVPILCYHRFGGGGKMSTSAANFEAQLDWLAHNDYHVIRLSQLTAYLEGKGALPKRSVVITIDDGYESVYRYAFPALRKHGFPATLFVYTDFIGAGDALTWPQLQEVVSSGLIDIGAHSKSHRNLIERSAGETDSQYRQGLEAEAKVPRDILEKRLSVKVRTYAFPYGDANDLVLEALARQQYQLAATVTPGGNAFFAQPMMLRRTMIFGDHDLETFKSKLQISRRAVSP